jgi:hypothetical protein
MLACSEIFVENGETFAEMNFAQSCGGNISAARLFLADLP